MKIKARAKAEYSYMCGSREVDTGSPDPPDPLENHKLLYVFLSLSDREHTAYKVGNPCKPYIQPNLPWPYPSYTPAIRVYPRKPCMIFKTFKKTDTGAVSVYNRISDRTRP